MGLQVGDQLGSLIFRKDIFVSRENCKANIVQIIMI